MATGREETMIDRSTASRNERERQRFWSSSFFNDTKAKTIVFFSFSDSIAAMFLFKTAEIDANFRWATEWATELTDSSFQLVFIFMIRRWNLARRRRWRRPLRQSRRRWAAVTSLGQSPICGYVPSWIHKNVSFLLLLLSLPLRTFPGAASCTAITRLRSLLLLLHLFIVFLAIRLRLCVSSHPSPAHPRAFSRSFQSRLGLNSVSWLGADGCSCPFLSSSPSSQFRALLLVAVDCC